MKNEGTGDYYVIFWRLFFITFLNCISCILARGYKSAITLFQIWEINVKCLFNWKIVFKCRWVDTVIKGINIWIFVINPVKYIAKMCFGIFPSSLSWKSLTRKIVRQTVWIPIDNSCESQMWKIDIFIQSVANFQPLVRSGETSKTWIGLDIETGELLLSIFFYSNFLFKQKFFTEYRRKFPKLSWVFIILYHWYWIWKKMVFNSSSFLS